MHTFKYSLHSIIAAALLVLAAGMAGCKKDDTSTNPTSSGTTGGNTNAVTMQNSAFNPATLTVTAGTKVTWTNDDNMTHTVTSGTPGSPDGMFNSGNMAAGATFQFTFANKGTFKYYCIIHQNTMQGTVVVN